MMRNALILLLALCFLPACSGTRVGKDARSGNSAKTLTFAEWESFGDQIASVVVGRLNAFKASAREPGRTGPVVVAIDKFENRTGSTDVSFERTQEILTSRIQSQLINSGVAQVSMIQVGTGGQRSELGNTQTDTRLDAEFDQGTVVESGRAQAAEVFLMTSLIANKYQEGRTINYDYQAQVRIIDARSRLVIGQATVTYQKDYDRGIFGG